MKHSLCQFMPVVLVCSALSGCAGLNTLSSATTPTDLFTLTPKSTFDPTLPRLRQQIVVDEPTANAGINSDRIPVQPTPLQVKFLPGVRWIDTAPSIVQTLLIESYENTNKVDAVGRSAVTLRADYTIVTDLREFQAQLKPESGPNAPLVVDVTMNMKVVEATEDRIIASRSFESLVAAESDSPDDIAEAFDTALGRVLRNSVEWSIRRMHSHTAKMRAEAEARQAMDSFVPQKE